MREEALQDDMEAVKDTALLRPAPSRRRREFVSLCLVVLLIGTLLVYKNIESSNRRLAENGKYLPEPGRYFEHAGKKVRNTTNSQLPKLFKVSSSASTLHFCTHKRYLSSL